MTPCPDELELSRALSEGPSAAFASHLAACAACRLQQQRFERAIELARLVGAPMPTAERREELRTALLASVDQPARVGRPRRRMWVGAVAMASVAAAAALAVVALRSGTGGRGRAAEESGAVLVHRHATVRAAPTASFAPMSPGPDEIVVLHDGAIDVEVSPLHAGERFRVLVGDAEVEVHGTAFQVTARAGVLTDVVVDHGVVEVRAKGERRRLTAGQAWRAPAAVTAAAAPELEPVAPNIAAPPAAAPPVAVGTGKASPGKASPAELRREAPRAPAPTSEARAPQRAHEEVAYDEGWAAMRAGRFAQAASAFMRAQVLSPTGPLAEDAGFWYAVALARSGKPTLATSAFRDFLETYPRARRAGEASAMLGWILVEAGHAREAEQRFRAASADPRSEVRTSATSGLEAVSKLTSKSSSPSK